MKTHASRVTRISLAAAIALCGVVPTSGQQKPQQQPQNGPAAAAPIPRPKPEGEQPPLNPAGHPPQPRPPEPPAVTPAGLPPSFVLPEEFRTLDGSDNNPANPAWGTPNQPFLRKVPADYADAISEPSGANRPSARIVSNEVARQRNARPNRRGASDMLWQWGQFLDHDLDETPSAVPAEPFPIAVPLGDRLFDPNSTGTVTIGLNRSAYEMVDGVRQQTSGITAWIDASQVYGSNDIRAEALRAMDGTGRLKATASAFGDLLPFNTEEIANIPPGPSFFVAGDVRVNEQTGLIAIHTLFVREHNHWADLYKVANPEADDEEIYQFARLIVGAEMQAITYREFLPVLLGPNAIPPYRGYNEAAEPTISNEFATAAYRLGHSLLSSVLRRLDAQGREIPEGHLTLAQSFFQPQQVTAVGIDSVLRGLVSQRCQELDEWLIDDVRNFLFGAPGSGGLDLASLNIQRGRDHALPTFAAMRQALNLRPVRRFQDVNPNGQVLRELDNAYDSPLDIDLWIGGLAEPHRPGSMVGETFQRILVDQFVRLRDGDRFWYQRYLPAEMVQMIHQQTLATIIRRNTTIRNEIGNNAFLAPPRAPVGVANPPRPPADGTQAPQRPPAGGTPPPQGGTQGPPGGAQPPQGPQPPQGGTRPPPGGTQPPQGGTRPAPGGTQPPQGGTLPQPR